MSRGLIDRRHDRDGGQNAADSPQGLGSTVGGPLRGGAFSGSAVLAARALPGSTRRSESLIVTALATILALALVFSPRHVRAEGVDEADCAVCHDGSEVGVPGVFDEHFLDSVHEGFSCLECHADIEALPHEDELAPVSCGNCHDDVGEIYASHGLGQVGVTDDLPGCGDCHGTHRVLAVADPRSPAHPDNLPSTCARCHDDINLTRKHEIKLQHAAEMYESSVHGVAHRDGNQHRNDGQLAAVCIDCHGTDGSAHQILPRGDTKSAINHFNIPNTCGQCHAVEAAEYWDGVHGRFTLRGDTHSPVCTDCHGEHGILPTDDPRANVSAYRLAEATCTPCHASARINESYGVSNRVTFIDSYHGLKSKKGDTTVANCASCHGAHRILPSLDPRSSISADSLQTTCGGCHVGITTGAAQTSIHGLTPEGHWPGLVRTIYTILIVSVIGGMLVFVALDFRRLFRETLRQPQVERMSRNAVIQHGLLSVSFTVLVVTGLALRYSEHWPFQWIFGWDGGSGARGLIHRWAAGVFMLSVVWHFVYLFTRPGREFLRGMAPGRRDALEVAQSVRYNLEWTWEKPRFGRFGFVEKAEYWALVWGTVIMVATGFLLWFRNGALLHLDVSTGFLEVMRVIHLYEAWLATLAILIWHFYAVILKPGVYPGNPSWLTGSMPELMYEEEHAGEMDSRRPLARTEPPPPEAGRAVETPEAGEEKTADSIPKVARS